MKRSLMRIPTDLHTRVSKENICGLKVNVQSMVTPRYLGESHTEMFEVLYNKLSLILVQNNLVWEEKLLLWIFLD